MSTLRFTKRLGRTFLVLSLGYGAALLPCVAWTSYCTSVVEPMLMPPWVIANMVHTLGVPGILTHEGFCGWGRCEPTLMGWVAGCSVLILAFSLTFLLLSSLKGRRRLTR